LWLLFNIELEILAIVVRNKVKYSQALCLMLAIPATWETEVEGLWLESRLRREGRGEEKKGGEIM
jgi:hypothetical protein